MSRNRLVERIESMTLDSCHDPEKANAKRTCAKSPEKATEWGSNESTYFLSARHTSSQNCR
jgi:hypothetical protein